MNKKLSIAILILVAVLLTTFLVRNNQQGILDIQQTNNTQIDSPNPPQEIQETTLISKTELAKHNSLTDCWIAYNGKVYDITSYLPRHPGSSGAISTYCGSADEFEKAFTKKHGTSKVNSLMKVGTFIGDFDVIGTLN